ncbi:MAG: hypothetical protein U5Q03_01545 [Bacteroidota bacterium]|nr:hypothetical protein [Bacteroidota bacterium]
MEQLVLLEKRLFENILNNSEDEDLGFDQTKFPPEKAIYLTLLKQTGIHQQRSEGFAYGSPVDNSFQMLWNTCVDFLESTKSARKKLTELTNALKAKPFKLKQGFLDFWVPLFLIIKKNDYALFSESIFIPSLNPDVLELINKSPDDFYIKSFDLSGYKLELFNKYREILNQVEEQNPGSENFIETIKPFMTFFNQLTNYAKSTKSISKKAIKLRQAIKETEDPEKAFFEEFPQALGYNTLDLIKSDGAIENFTIALKEGVQEINTSFDVLINRIESFIANEVIGENLSFPANKLYFQKRYKKLKSEILKPRQKVFYQRLTSVLDDKKSWLNSIAQACIDRPIDNFTDEDVKLFKHKFIEYVNELDNMTELSEKDINFEKEELIKLEISSVLKGLSKKFVRIPKSKYKQVEKIEEKLKEQLKDNDKAINIALLAKLLQDQFDHE